MSNESKQRLAIARVRGAKDLLADAVSAALDASESLQSEITRQPYALLQRIDAIAVPVRKVEAVQSAITTGIYATIRRIGGVGGKLADGLLDLAEQLPSRRC